MLDRRRLLASAGAVAFASTLPVAGWAQAPAQASPRPGSEGAKLAQLLDSIFNDSLVESPERATSLGLDKGDRAGLKSLLDDRSGAAKASRLAKASAQKTALSAINRNALSGIAKVDRDVIAYQLQTAVDGGERFSFGNVGGRYAPYVISQLTGAYQDVPDFLDNQHKVETKADADAYLARLKGFAVALDQDLERARTDTAGGVVAPDFILDTTLAQLNALRGSPAGDTVLALSLQRKAKAVGLDGDYGAKAAAIVSQEVFPALDRQIRLIQGLRTKAAHEPGVWRLPDGDAYYAAALGAATPTTLAPAEVHKMGLAQVADIAHGIDKILRRRGLTTGTVAERLTALNDDPTQLYANTDEGRAALIDQLNAQIERVYGRLPRAFHTVPKTKVTVKRVPPFIQDGAPNGYYQRAALDGSRPAIYFINLKDTHDWPKFGLPTLTYHEAANVLVLRISGMAVDCCWIEICR